MSKANPQSSACITYRMPQKSLEEGRSPATAEERDFRFENQYC
jgi:hypothetical protein